MNQVWQALHEPRPIVEFHDVRTEAGAAREYLDLMDGPLAAPFVTAGGALLGHFEVDLHPGRVILMRGFSHSAARRQALNRFHASREWTQHRAAVRSLEREANVLLTRAVAPSSGTRPLQPGTGYTAMISELRFPDQIGNYHLWLRLLLRKSDLDPVAAFATLEMANDVPAVPVIANRTHHIALIPQGGRVPKLPPELRAMVRFPPEILSLQPAPAMVW